MNAVLCDKCKKVCTQNELAMAKSLKRTLYRNPKDANKTGQDVWEWFHLCDECNKLFDKWMLAKTE